MGHSAGAHLAALVATDGRRLAAEGRDLPLIKGVILLDGACYDIPAEYRLPPMKEMIETAFGTDPQVWKDASPVSHIKPGVKYPAFLIAYATGRVAARFQAERLAGRLKDAGCAARVVPVEVAANDGVRGPLEQHLLINARFGLPDDPLTQQSMQFLDSIRRATAARR